MTSRSSKTSSAVPIAPSTLASGWPTTFVRALTTTASTLFQSINNDHILPLLSNHSQKANADTIKEMWRSTFR
ncbi:hypothetical protein MJO29_006500 [Puccinia striiformis f. sp. tritici]|nr:hypothetical protein MJO29_006500 [Puccinia striiformis f. sp. tritici]